MHISSESRARAFLWLCYHYHEAPSDNPYADGQAGGDGERAPQLINLTPHAAAYENVDTPEENQRGLDMTDIRRRFLETKARGEDFGTHQEADIPPHQRFIVGGRGKGKGRAPAETLKTRETSPADSQYSVPYSLNVREEDMLEGARPFETQHPRRSNRHQVLGDRQLAVSRPLLWSTCLGIGRRRPHIDSVRTA